MTKKASTAMTTAIAVSKPKMSVLLPMKRKAPMVSTPTTPPIHSKMVCFFKVALLHCGT